MTWVAVAAAGAAVIGGIASNSAANKQARSAQKGLDWTKAVYRDAEGNLRPYIDAGTGALGGLSSLAAGDYSGFNTSPDYLYARGEAQYGVDHSAAARGSLYSGGHSLDLANAMNGIASQNLGNYRNSLQYLATLGSNSASNLANTGNGLAGNVQAGYNGIGQAGANAATGWGQAGAGVATAFGNYMTNKNNSSFANIKPANGG